MVAALEGGDAGFSGGEDGGFEGGFDGFETGVSQQGFAGLAGPALEGEVAEFFAELDFEACGMDIAHGMEERCGLVAEGVGSGAVAEGGDAEGAGEVEEAVAVGIPDVRSVGAFPEDGPIGRGEGGVAAFDAAEACGEFEGARAWDFRDQRGKHASSLVRMMHASMLM